MAMLAGAYVVAHGVDPDVVPVDVVSFGAPGPGDEELARFCDERLNVRQLAYLGMGQAANPYGATSLRGRQFYGIGDVVVGMQ